MDSTGKNHMEQGESNEDPGRISFSSPNMPSDWQVTGSNLAASSMTMIPTNNAMAVCRGDLSESGTCTSAPIANSFCPTTWEQVMDSHNLGFCDVNVQNNASNLLTPVGTTVSGMGPLRAGIGWTTTPDTILKAGMFSSTAPRTLPHSLPQFPADSGFIERAARFSCFSGGNIGDTMNPFCVPDPMNPYSGGLTLVQGPQNVFTDDGLRSVSGAQPQNNKGNITESSGNTTVLSEHRPEERNPLTRKMSESMIASQDEAKQGNGVSANESDEAEFSGRGGQEEMDGPGAETSSKVFGSRKRKRSGQDIELNQSKGTSQSLAEARKDHTENHQNRDVNLTSDGGKPGGKNSKQACDAPKEEYIHVRARRGQATNSHSLAERVRREKISERMKFLQDLVPGCSKVTGKAVMLDEIINYVQSLQRQVEFLSMKLATVNPRVEFNIESLLAKDILQLRAGPSFHLAFPPDSLTIPYPTLHQHQHGMIQLGFPGFGGPADAFHRTKHSQLTTQSGGFKEPMSQVPNVWEDELHNVVQMDFNSTTPLTSQDLSGPSPPVYMKSET